MSDIHLLTALEELRLGRHAAQYSLQLQHGAQGQRPNMAVIHALHGLPAATGALGHAGELIASGSAVRAGAGARRAAPSGHSAEHGLPARQTVSRGH